MKKKVLAGIMTTAMIMAMMTGCGSSDTAKDTQASTGNETSADSSVEQYAIPALLRAAGRREESCIPARTVCTLTNGFSKPSKGYRYLRATACGGKVTLPGAGNTEAHSSGALSAMMGCNCLVEIPAGSGPVEPGIEVEVLCFVQ